MKNLKLTLKAWPVIAIATIGLCYLTQMVAGWFGITLPDQQNIDIVRKHAGWNWVFAFLCAQILVLMPAAEELIFRGLLFKLPATKIPLPGNQTARVIGFAVLSSVLFSAAHYIAQPFPDAAFIALFYFGIAQCWLYRKSGYIWCSMLNHALFNLTNLILLFLIPQA